jgi:hypothetical protein
LKVVVRGTEGKEVITASDADLVAVRATKLVVAMVRWYLEAPEPELDTEKKGKRC